MESRRSHLIALVGLSWCGITTLVSATCQPPAAGYNFETSVDKYYKPVMDSVTWQSAKTACSSDGTMLVELRTAADYQAIRPIFGELLDDQSDQVFAVLDR